MRNDSTENGWQVIQFAPSEIPAGEGVRQIAGANGLLKGLATANALHRLVHLSAGCCNLTLTGIGLECEQCMEHVILWLRQGLTFLCPHEVAHFLICDLDALIDVSTLHTLNDHFSSNLLPHGVVRLVALLEGLLELLESHIILGRNTAYSLIKLLVGDTDAGTTAFL